MDDEAVVLSEVLADAQSRGVIGPGSLEDHIAQAEGFLAGRDPWFEGWIADLGSGGGLPGLPLALAFPLTQWVLIDAQERRTEALERAVERLGLSMRVQVRHVRAEDLGRGVWRGRFDVVVARGFGPPAVTAECAAPLLRVGGELIVSDTAEGDRWPAEALAELGLVASKRWRAGRFAYRSFVQEEECPERFPRRAGIVAKRPLFR